MDTTETRYRIYNVERTNTMPGGISEPFDRAIVVDVQLAEPHILTGQPQPKVVYRGDLSGAHAFVKAAR